jgi:hypothetical protein
MGVSNDPFLSKGSCRAHKKLQREPLSLLTLRSCDCNSYHYRIVKEHPGDVVPTMAPEKPASPARFLALDLAIAHQSFD